MQRCEKRTNMQYYTRSNDKLLTDISVCSFWQRLQRVFYPFAESYQKQLLAAMKTMELNQKKTKYNQRILNGENGFFTSLVFTNSGMSTETKYYRRLSQQLIEKSDASYSDTKLKKITTEMTKINP